MDVDNINHLAAPVVCIALKLRTRLDSAVINPAWADVHGIPVKRVVLE
jgi:hypothetical protein